MSRTEAAAAVKTLAERAALVTGAASGIGKAIAQLFAGAGAAVAVLDLDVEGGHDTVRGITGDGGRAFFLEGDVSRSDDCRRAVDHTVEVLGGLDILVNNAGIIRRANVLETSEEEWDRLMAVNLKSVYLLSRLAIPLMAEAGGGAIINIASGWGLVGGRQAAAYCASKGGVVQLTRALAIDHGPQNIRVNCICPGDTDTPLLREEARQLGQQPERLLDQAAQRPLGRIAVPADIAQAALYLASDAAAAVTGTTLIVDAGGLAGSA